MTLRLSGPSQTPTLNGIPTAEPQVSFCVEKPLMPECARMLGSEAGKPKQSGNIYSSLAMPNSLRNQLLPYRIWRMIDSAFGEFTSPSSIDEPAGNQRPVETQTFKRSKSDGE